jgi:CheY-like chemotaxis protein
MFLGTQSANADIRVNNPTILVIEDEDALSSLLKSELSSLGYRVVLARDGHEGLAQIQSVEPELIICDRAMPHMTGSQLLERLRGAYPQYKSVPFIFMTALTDPRDRAAVQSLEPFAYLEKPLDFNLLKKTIEKALSL